MNQNQKTNNKQKILNAAIECIEQYGLEKVTVRNVAQAAKVNIAAINYYFGSKDKLLHEVLRQTLHEAFINNIHDYLQKNDIGKNDLADFFAHNLEGMINYPHIVKAHFHDAYIDNNYKGMAMSRLHIFLESMQSKIKRVSKEKDEALQFSLIQIFSAVFMIGLFPSLYQKFLSLDLKNEQVRKKYINHLLDHYLIN
ncbi:TetR/AcrR family transcriptional regulator [Candidatus Beckwithbacteria bacterium]|nr:TetR/AcrR family transcriptional regulator [Candidatus Beckwithbacteria bacterium]